MLRRLTNCRIIIIILLLLLVLLLKMVLNLDSSWSLGQPSTGRIWQLAYNTNHKQGTTKLLKLLNKYLLLVTVENGENYSIW